jgi:hypothetical protein
MKQVLFIGDIHGKSDWITYAEYALKANIEIVFMGDYVDSFDDTGYKIEQNLLRIIAFKKKADKRREKKALMRPKVTLLLGNHDYAYMMGKSGTSGFSIRYEQVYRDIFHENWDLFDVAWGYEDILTKKYTLATHAGLTQDYWDSIKNDDEYSKFVEQIITDPWQTPKIHEVLNILKDKFTLLWSIGYERGGVSLPGIIWADISELILDPYKDINQVVGHSAYHSPEMYFKNGSFIAKVDGFGDGVERMILNF